jgi:hypothetical protein
MSLSRSFTIRVTSLLLSAGLFLSACSAAKDALESVDVPRKTIDVSILGTNAFASDLRFGSTAAQLREVRDELGLNHVRVLFAWTDAVQPTPSSPLNLGFYDEVAASIPAGVDALVVLTGAPGWMANSANWSGGNPRRTFVEEFVAPIAERYAGNSKIVGYEVWNEPNNPSFGENTILQVTTDPVAYVELLAFAHNAIKSASPSKLVLNGGTTAINQNFSETIDYNRAMRDAGAQNFLDKWAVHFYGKQFENVTRSGGVEDFLNELSVGVWVTESGAQGVNSQLAYGEQVWPFLQEKVARLERIYQYQFAEASPAETSYGMRTLDPAFPVSDLYVHLSERAK